MENFVGQKYAELNRELITLLQNLVTFEEIRGKYAQITPDKPEDFELSPEEGFGWEELLTMRAMLWLSEAEGVVLTHGKFWTILQNYFAE
jgi:hypothetical protein